MEYYIYHHWGKLWEILIHAILCLNGCDHPWGKYSCHLSMISGSGMRNFYVNSRCQHEIRSCRISFSSPSWLYRKVTLLHLSDHDDFQPSVTCRCFTHRSSESANLKQMKSIYFLQRRLMLRSQGYLNDQLAGSNFSWHQAKVAGAALIYCYLCPRVGTDGTFWQRPFLAGKHPFDWDAHSFTCLKIMCREQTVEKNTEAKPKYILLCMQYLIDHLDDSFGCLGFTALPTELRVG